jgi:phosphohistidine swiveling domain-containing protein
MSFLVEFHAADARLGGKARSLAMLAEQGLETPPGFAISDTLFRALCPAVPEFEHLDQAALDVLDGLRGKLMRTDWPTGFRDELYARLGGIGAASYAVRSSFASEDLPGQLAPGVYESCGNVPLYDVERAIRQVLCSALAPGAVAYAMAHGEKPAKAPVAVLMHAFVKGDAEGSAAFAPERMEEPLIPLRRGQLTVEAKAALGRRLAMLASVRGPTEIEWVFAEGRVVYLQARPFEPPAPQTPWTGFDDLPDGAGTRTLWRWDASHNPLPLSPAQAGLVEFVDERCTIGIRQRVLGGYLFYCRDHRPLPPAIAPDEADAFFASLCAEVEARLGRLGIQPDLEEALALFLFTYEPIFGVLQPALRQSRASLREFLESHAPAALALLPALLSGVPSLASERRELAARILSVPSQAASARADYLARFGDEAPMWDVRAATYAEQPDALLPDSAQRTHECVQHDWQEANTQVEAMLVPGMHDSWQKSLGAARAAVALGEADDWLYARTQTAVRRALLAIGQRLHHATRLRKVEDIYFLPLPLIRRAANGGEESSDLAMLASEGRSAWMRACNHPPPLPDGVDGKAARGAGTGGRAIGRVTWHRPGLPASAAADTILVAKTLLPTELPLINAIAFVTETGRSLDHVAAQARERGIPAVVGVQGASSLFSDGDLVLVDADAGLVVKLA